VVTISVIKQCVFAKRSSKGLGNLSRPIHHGAMLKRLSTVSLEFKGFGSVFDVFLLAFNRLLGR